MPFDEWMTDPKVIELARATMGSIDFDPASNMVAQRYVKAHSFCVHPDEYNVVDFIKYDVLRDGLDQVWHGNVWCNPPYSAGNIDRFVDKAIDEWNGSIALLDDDYYSRSRCIQQMMILVNSATDTKWYHKLLEHSSCTLLWRGRIKFWKIQDGKAHEKWEGEKSKEKGLGKIGNAPRYLNTLFYFGSSVERFKETFKEKGTFIHVSR